MKTLTKNLLVLLILLQILDGLITGVAISLYGVWVEGNPIIKFFVSNFGLISLVPIKGIAVFILILFIKNLEKIYNPVFNLSVILVTSIYLAVVFILWPYFFYYVTYVL